jgi:hypothetical protein
MLNIGAVVGLSFSLDEVIGVQMRTSDGQENTVRRLTLEALEAAADQGILDTRTIGGEQGSGGKESVKYSFYHAVWRTALLNLMLEGRKKDLHQAIAESLAQEEKGIEDYMFQTKLFTHWICANDFAKAAQLASTLGKHFEERLGLPAKSIRLYNEALNLVRESSDISIGVGGKWPIQYTLFCLFITTLTSHLFLFCSRFYCQGSGCCRQFCAILYYSIAGGAGRLSCNGTTDGRECNVIPRRAEGKLHPSSGFGKPLMHN